MMTLLHRLAATLLTLIGLGLVSSAAFSQSSPPVRKEVLIQYSVKVVGPMPDFLVAALPSGTSPSGGTQWTPANATDGGRGTAAEGSPQIFGESAFRGKKAAGRPYAAA